MEICQVLKVMTKTFGSLLWTQCMHFSVACGSSAFWCVHWSL